MTVAASLKKTYKVHYFCFSRQDLLQEVKQLKSKVEELEGERSQYERKLRATKVTHVSG